MYFLYLLLCLPALIVSYPIVALLLLTDWNGKTTIFGNSKWGKGDTNPAYLKSGYKAAFLWLAYRNPINNLLYSLSVKKTNNCIVKGDLGIGDQTYGGWYLIRMGKAWEFYYVKPYLRKWCIRIRLGWKINEKPEGADCPLVFVLRPIMNYKGK